MNKQICLKPQDVVVTLKIALLGEDSLSFQRLGSALYLSASEAHASTRRASLAGLLATEERRLKANKSILCNFLINGAPYAFPAIPGPIQRGLPTGITATPSSSYIRSTQTNMLVWPSADGPARGSAITPLYPNLVLACQHDELLYRPLAAFDSIRSESARERTLAISYLQELLL